MARRTPLRLSLNKKRKNGLRRLRQSAIANGWVGQRNLPASLSQDRTWTSRFIRPPSFSHCWLCFIQELLSFPIDPQTKRNDPAPSLHSHYRNFVTTTSWPAPVLRIGTLTLMVSATWISSLTSERQVPAFPYKSLDQIHVTSTPDTVHPVIRLPMNLSGSTLQPPILMSNLAFTTLHQCFSFIRLFDRYLPT